MFLIENRIMYHPNMTYDLCDIFCQLGSYGLLPYEVDIFQYYIELHELGHCAASINYPAMD